MNKNRRLLILSAGLCMSLAAWAAGPQVSTRFIVEDPETRERTTVSEARLDQFVCIEVNANLTPDGDHALELTLHDGLGRETHFYRVTITAERGTWKRTYCFDYNEHRDAPGTWWYVGEFDGEPLFSQSIEIRPPLSWRQ